MKLVDTTCPHCGAHLKVDLSNKQAVCEHCGATILIDDETQHVQYDNAEEAGYKFEKGRQRAQAEMAGAAYVSSRSPKQNTPKKKRKTWLWVIGWLLIFPLPLTILLLRKKEMKPVLKYGIIAAAWIVYIIIGLSGGSSDNGQTAQTNDTSSVVETIPTEENAATDISEETSEEASSETMDEMTALQAFYDDFSVNGSLDNLKDMVSKYGLYTDHRKDGIGHDTYKVAYTKDLAKVISNSDLTTAGNYVVIKFNLLGDDSVDSITFHTDADDAVDNTPVGPTEMNSLLELFASLETTTTREEIDAYIADNGMVKYAFTQDSAYEIGYEGSAIRSRGRDREGEAVDVSFVTSGDTERLGMVKSASYAVHTGFSTHTSLEFENGIFYYEGEACESGQDAVQKFLESNRAKSNNDTSENADGNLIDSFVNAFNAESETPLELKEEFTPSDTSSGHYRTEFRLGAYKDAIGKSFAYGDVTVDIIYKKPMLGDGNIRIYMDGASLDQCKELLSKAAPIMDETATSEDIQEAVDYISEHKEANGYYFANLGLLLLGNDNKGYEFMLKMGND